MGVHGVRRFRQQNHGGGIEKVEVASLAVLQGRNRTHEIRGDHRPARFEEQRSETICARRLVSRQVHDGGPHLLDSDRQVLVLKVDLRDAHCSKVDGVMAAFPFPKQVLEKIPEGTLLFFLISVHIALIFHTVDEALAAARGRLGMEKPSARVPLPDPLNSRSLPPLCALDGLDSKAVHLQHSTELLFFFR